MGSEKRPAHVYWVESVWFMLLSISQARRIRGLEWLVRRKQAIKQAIKQVIKQAIIPVDAKYKAKPDRAPGAGLPEFWRHAAHPAGR